MINLYKITCSSIYVEFCNVSSKFWLRDNTDNLVWFVLSTQSFYKVSLRLIQSSISNVFKKLNERQQNLTHIFLMTFFWSALCFPIFLANFDQRTVWFCPCYPHHKDSVNKTFFCFKYLCLLSSFFQKAIWSDLCNSVFEKYFEYILLILKLDFNIAYYWATSLCLTSFNGTNAWNFRKATW